MKMIQGNIQLREYIVLIQLAPLRMCQHQIGQRHT